MTMKKRRPLHDRRRSRKNIRIHDQRSLRNPGRKNRLLEQSPYRQTLHTLPCWKTHHVPSHPRTPQQSTHAKSPPSSSPIGSIPGESGRNRLAVVQGYAGYIEGDSQVS